MEISELSPKEVFDRILASENDVIVDVRTDEEWNEAHVDAALHHVLDTLAEHWEELKQYDNVYFLCRSGGRSEVATVQAQAAGLSNVHNILGGIKRWKKDGLAVV